MQAAEALATRTLALRPVPLALPAEAIVEAVSQAVVAAQVSGRVLEMRVDAGQTVRRGEVLLRLDAREAAESAAAAKAALINARANYERVKSLNQQKFVSQAAVDKARAELDAAQANSGGALASQSHATITAPMSGIVAARHTEAGEMAAPGKALLTIFDPRSLRVVASVPQFKLAELRTAARAWVEFPELGRRIESGDITILPTVDQQTHVVQVRIKLPPEAAFAVPGMAARVHFVTGEASRLTVPAGAILRRGEVASVYVVAADGRLSLRQLRLGDAVADGEIEVLAGLRPGESVALDPVKAGIALRQPAAAK